MSARERRAAVLRARANGASYSEAAAAAGCSRRTAIRICQAADALPDSAPSAVPRTPRAVLEQLLLDPTPRIRLDAARALAVLDLEDEGATPDYDRVEVIEDLPEGAKPYSLLQVHRPPAT